jgi:peptidoglycan L-alanyl-D-glutamate endopeptidase CwlK
MAKLNQRSLDNLAECHKDLQRVAHEAIKVFHFQVICGHRGKREQDEAYATGKSKVRFPNSKHNKRPSHAFDATPVPLDWSNKKSFDAMGRAFKAAAQRVGVSIKWGGDFKNFYDGPHIELS